MRAVHQVIVVHLVDDENHFLRRAAQQIGHRHVQIGDPGRHFDQKQNHVGLLDGQHHLLADFLLENILSAQRVSARIDHRKLAAVPVGLAVMAVARRTGRIVHDRLAHADQAVEQRALADVRTAHDSYYTHLILTSD